MTGKNEQPQTAMILAAGRGERMRPFTDTRPKPLAELGGKPLIQHHVEQLAAAGVKRIVINIAWLGSQIPLALGNGERFGVEICYSDEGPTPLDTGGGIFKALPLLGTDPFWVVSADLFTDYRIYDPLKALAANDLAHLVMVENPDFHPRGDFCLADRRISETVGTRFTYASIALLRPALFSDAPLGVFSIVPLLIDAMRKGRVSGELFHGVWHNIGTLAQLASLDRSLRAAV
jgi:N-acetyl-alpha-D-muramate 1-phosphate uridylyltransferase